MARSKTSRRDSRTRRYVIYLIPLIAIMSIGVTYALYAQQPVSCPTAPTSSSPAAMDFTFQMTLQESNKESTQIAGIVPSTCIGESRGYWATTQFNGNRVDSDHYPIYMDSPTVACPRNAPPCTIHVRSNVAHNYTLGDFFNVWGYPLGMNNTLNVPSNGNFAWQLCVGANPQTATFNTQWGNLVVKSGMQLVLFYVDYGKAGCAQS